MSTQHVEPNRTQTFGLARLLYKLVISCAFPENNSIHFPAHIAHPTRFPIRLQKGPQGLSPSVPFELPPLKPNLFEAQLA
ncbi:MAG: hypothetical protein JSY10_16620 [Paenibacillus sp.]|nr:hypothetical protein [Paenibacillus sp.]